MDNVMGFWYGPPNTWDDFYQCVILGHGFFDEKTKLCAWSEGWATFLALAVNGDPFYTFASGGSVDLELPTWPVPPDQTIGDTVEGRVIGALYDLFDNSNDGFDQVTFGFTPIWDIVSSSPDESSFSGFWDSWKAKGHNKHLAVQAIYQNTIDYNTSPRINLPSRTLLENFTYDNAINLWEYSEDDESYDWELDWQIIYVGNWHCDVSIDAQDFVDIIPYPDWLGTCDVIIRVSDGIKTTDDTFTIRVVPVAAQVYLPLVMRNHSETRTTQNPGDGHLISPLPTPALLHEPTPLDSPLPTP